MIDLSGYAEDLNNFNKDFKRADNLAQDVKLLTGKEVIPAIIQLRYAGFHISEFLLNEDSKYLEKAKSHAKRAVFEAARYGIAFCGEAIKKFQEMYQSEILPDTVTKYSEKMLIVQKAKDGVLVDGNEDERADACESSFYKIKSILVELMACQDVLNQRAEEKVRDREQKKKETQRWKIMFFIAVASLVVMVVNVILNA
ncbi:MAG: hypothetical protein LBH98_01280 [Chitinispirillales bacterium]|nr:hypothetical protein [Chitinispirillales bacterium]